jgi:hypothetical protein
MSSMYAIFLHPLPLSTYSTASAAGLSSDWMSGSPDEALLRETEKELLQVQARVETKQGCQTSKPLEAGPAGHSVGAS